jgi:hypothetical protein
MAIRVEESNYTISGQIIAALKSFDSRLNLNSVLVDKDGKQWKIVDDQVKIGSAIKKLIAAKGQEVIFFYKLLGIGHSTRPEVGDDLKVLENVS